jgi:hypothetical protein
MIRTPGNSAPLLISSRRRFASADFTNDPDAALSFVDFGMGAYIERLRETIADLRAGQRRMSAQTAMVLT